MTSRIKPKGQSIVRAVLALGSVVTTTASAAAPATSGQPAHPVLQKQQAQADWQPPAATAPPPSPEPKGPSTAPHMRSPGGAGKAAAPTQTSTMPPTAPSLSQDKYPDVGELEKMMFGQPSPAVAIETRLDNLENALYKKTSPALPVPERITNLARDLTGAEIPGLEGASQPPYSPVPGYNADPHAGLRMSRPPEQPPPNVGAAPRPPEDDDNTPFWQEALSHEQLDKFALEYLNKRRSEQGLNALSWDPLAEKIGKELLKDLCQNNTVSHNNSKNENPDIRYTKSGGTDAMLESVVAARTSGRLKLNRALVRQLFDILEQRQDDKMSLFSPDATQFGFGLGQTPENDRLIGVCEVITKHGEFAPIPAEVSVGDKIEVKGKIEGGYHFDKISLAWEGGLPGGEPFEESDEALPYFAPLDYEAHGQKAERNWEGRIKFMQIVAIAGIAAGSFFMPPVALAAPLIMAAPAMSGSSKPRAVSDIPVHGGVKVDGSGSFAHKVTVSKDGKEGIYYITVWATTGEGATPVPLSRRAVIARGITQSGTDNDGDDNAQPEIKLEKTKDKEKDKDKDRDEKEEKGKKDKDKDKRDKDEKQAYDEAPAPPSLNSDDKPVPTDVNKDLDQGSTAPN